MNNNNHVGGGIGVCGSNDVGDGRGAWFIGNESCYGMWILHPMRAVEGKKK